MKTLNILTRTLFLAILALQFAVAAAQTALPTVIKNDESIRPRQPGTVRTDLQRHDISIAGYEAIQARVDFKPHTAFGMHAHPGEEIIYVLEGRLEYQIEGDSPVTLKAGDVLFVPAGKYHSARNTGNNNAAELATYVVEKNKPLVVLKK